MLPRHSSSFPSDISPKVSRLRGAANVVRQLKAHIDSHCCLAEMHRKSNLGSTRTQIANSELPFSSYLINGKRYWTKQGVPGPVPGILTGNATDYEKGLHTLDERWIGKYGKTYGLV